MNVHNLSPIVYTCEAQMCLRSLFTCLLETACIKTNNTLKRKIPCPNPHKYTKGIGSLTI